MRDTARTNCVDFGKIPFAFHYSSNPRFTDTQMLTELAHVKKTCNRNRFFVAVGFANPLDEETSPLRHIYVNMP